MVTVERCLGEFGFEDGNGFIDEIGVFFVVQSLIVVQLQQFCEDVVLSINDDCELVDQFKDVL